MSPEKRKHHHHHVKHQEEVSQSEQESVTSPVNHDTLKMPLPEEGDSEGPSDETTFNQNESAKQ
jgi:hypothetical protein